MSDADRRAQRPVSAKKHAVRMAGISVIAGTECRIDFELQWKRLVSL